MSAPLDFPTLLAASPPHPSSPVVPAPQSRPTTASTIHTGHRSAPTSPTHPLEGAPLPPRSHSAPTTSLDIFSLTHADVDAWLSDNLASSPTPSHAHAFPDPQALVYPPSPTPAAPAPTREPTPEEQVQAILDDIAAELSTPETPLLFDLSPVMATITPLALVGAPAYYAGAVVPPPRTPVTPSRRRTAAKQPSPLRNAIALPSSSASASSSTSSATSASAHTPTTATGSSPAPTPAKRRTPKARRAPAPAAGGFTFVNFTVADGDELSAGVAPSGGKGKPKREEDDNEGGARKRRKA
ncbi:uncharacterized protein LOC62_05G006743 [Vanrija pseudolonga]|uniref:Uncharacterized protein n=1 Tax=Vanrija pseudolonga TaxID=143232 RepID=A0AAF1BMA4_9TREE|nr:hypothetical protein LOC62_05G006743 [Vanrija pseudolonga]